MKKVIASAAALLLLLIFLHWQNNSITETEVTIVSEDLPAAFQGFKIIQLSDLHSKSFDKEQHSISERVSDASPDIIFFTGDLVDSKNYDEKPSIKLMEKLLETAPVVFVTGNHEWWSGHHQDLEEKLIELGVTVLQNENMQVKRGNEALVLLGIDDPASGLSLEEMMDSASKGTTGKFKVLLAHRPERFPEYQEYQIDLIFSGHAHGGQVRLPFVGGIAAPDQGFLPRYDAGVFRAGGSTLIVNRGLGNSIIPQRLFNRPEIVEVTLKSQ
ncbi:metallophosphoesterase [Bacillus salacetis]|uniref:metallophosphoesterase n=1 Tax=Bacillus salacetis TaxID=2315464 RepID=UPI001F0B9F72|nr:metallophosphoesterase [Bacillus salacetis]